MSNKMQQLKKFCNLKKLLMCGNLFTKFSIAKLISQSNYYNKRFILKNFKILKTENNFEKRCHQSQNIYTIKL